jgi:hypothetical protein
VEPVVLQLENPLGVIEGRVPNAQAAWG